MDVVVTEDQIESSKQNLFQGMFKNSVKRDHANNDVSPLLIERNKKTSTLSTASTMTSTKCTMHPPTATTTALPLSTTSSQNTTFTSSKNSSNTKANDRDQILGAVTSAAAAASITPQSSSSSSSRTTFSTTTSSTPSSYRIKCLGKRKYEILRAISIPTLLSSSSSSPSTSFSSMLQPKSLQFEHNDHSDDLMKYHDSSLQEEGGKNDMNDHISEKHPITKDNVIRSQSQSSSLLSIECLEYVPSDIPNFWHCPNCIHLPFSKRPKHSVVFHAHNNHDDDGSNSGGNIGSNIGSRNSSSSCSRNSSSIIPPPSSDTYNIIAIHSYLCKMKCNEIKEKTMTRKMIMKKGDYHKCVDDDSDDDDEDEDDSDDSSNCNNNSSSSSDDDDDDDDKNGNNDSESDDDDDDDDNDSINDDGYYTHDGIRHRKSRRLSKKKRKEERHDKENRFNAINHIVVSNNIGGRKKLKSNSKSKKKKKKNGKKKDTSAMMPLSKRGSTTSPSVTPKRKRGRPRKVNTTSSGGKNKSNFKRNPSSSSKKESTTNNDGSTSLNGQSSTKHIAAELSSSSSSSAPSRREIVKIDIPSTDNGLIEIPNDTNITASIDYYIMSQVKLCSYERSKDAIAYLRQKPLPEGYPGVQCIYCDKQWFFNSAVQLATGFPKIEQHLTGTCCENCPRDVKKQISIAKNQEDLERHTLRLKTGEKVTRRQYAKIVIERLGAYVLS